MNLGKEAGFMGTVLGIVIPMFIIYMLVQQGVKIAEKYAGKAGVMFQKFGSSATGLVGGAALGVATGGAAFLGRNVIGRGLGALGSQVVGKTTDGKEITRASTWAANANNSWLARKWNNTYNVTQTKSWDARNAGVKIGGKEYTTNTVLNSGLGLLGIKAKDQVSDVIGLGQNKALGKDGKPGGNVMINKKRADALQKEYEERIQMSHLSDDQAKAAWEKYTRDKVASTVEASEEYKAQQEKTKVVQERLTTAQKEYDKAKKEGTRYDQDLATNKFNAVQKELKDAQKAAKEKEEELIKKAADEKFSKKYGNIKDNKSFTNAMRAEYAENLQASSFWMQDGKPSNWKGIMTGTYSALIASMGPALAVIGGLFAKEMAEGLVDNVTGSRSKAIKAMIDKAKKSSGKDSPLAKLELKVAEHQRKIIQAVNEALGKAYKESEYDKLAESDDLEEGLATKEAELQDEIETIGVKVKTLTGQARKDELIKQQKTKNRLTVLRNAVKDLEQANKNLNEFKEKAKDKEDREKEKKDADKNKGK
jgi:hypothetical protein